MRVAIIGCGLIGRKRALALSADDSLVACCDTNVTIGSAFAADFKTSYFSDYVELMNSTALDAIIVAVVNKFSLPIVLKGIEKGLHVLVEKPLGRNASESLQIVTAQHQNSLELGRPLVVKTGFNHRYHPALFKAKEIISQGKIGDLLSIRARYGHGGRNGMEKEWRASKDLCGGGELLDQGVHIIDLCHWFGGEFKEVYGKAKTKYWPMEVEDNAFVYAETTSGVDVQFHVSWTNWRNIFSFEVFGSKGYVSVQGLGGSYGPESLEVGIRKPEGGRPDIETETFDIPDLSWDKEWMDFKHAIETGESPLGTSADGHYANKIIEAIYASSKSNTPELV